MECLVFRTKSKYAKFRKAYTTTSTLTHLLIPPTAVRGLIGAILGVDRVDLHNFTLGIDIAVEVINDINKDTQTYNLNIMNSEEGKSFSYQSNIEFLRDVEYRIFIKSADTQLINKIEEVLISGNYFYTPYLGGTEHVCKICYEGRYPCEKLDKGSYNVSSAFDRKSCEKIDVKDVLIYTDNLPVENNKTREYIKYKKVLFPVNQNVVTVTSDNIYRVGGKYIEFL